MEVITVLLSLVVYILGKRTEQPEANTAQGQRAYMRNRLWDSIRWEQGIRLEHKDARLRYFRDQIGKEREWWLSEPSRRERYAARKLEWNQRTEAVSRFKLDGERITERYRLGIDKSCPYVIGAKDWSAGDWEQEWKQLLGFREDDGYWIGNQETALELLKTKEEELEQRWTQMAPERLKMRRTKLRALELCIPLYRGKLEENAELIGRSIRIERERIDLGLEPEWFQVEFPRILTYIDDYYRNYGVASPRAPLPWRAEDRTSSAVHSEVCYGTGSIDSGFGDWEQKHNKSGIEIKWLEMDQKMLELEFEHQHLLGKDLEDPECVAEWQEMMQKWQEFVTELQEGN